MVRHASLTVAGGRKFVDISPVPSISLRVETQNFKTLFFSKSEKKTNDQGMKIQLDFKGTESFAI